MNRFSVLDDDWKPVPKKSPSKVQQILKEQQRLVNKFNYKYTPTSSGVENNSTFYVLSDVARKHQIEYLFDEAIKEAKQNPDIFGEKFECTVSVNVVRTMNSDHQEIYTGISYVDVSNPILYYTLLGLNPDGSERVLYEEDPTWEAPEQMDYSIDPFDESVSHNWADENPLPDRIRKELPPLIKLSTFELDEDQKAHYENRITLGSISIASAYISKSYKEDENPKVLFVQGVPSTDLDLLYTIFTRYARTPSTELYPKITTQKTRGNSITALVEYSSENDAGFAMIMLKKIRINFNGKEVIMTVRYAKYNRC